MRPRALLERYAVEALALALAVAGQIELWAGSSAGPRAAAVVAALVATMPLLLVAAVRSAPPPSCSPGSRSSRS
jgi:hypothetical protein